MLYLVLIVIIVFCLGIIFYILNKNKYKLEDFCKQTESKEKLDEVKRRIIENRLKQKLSGFFKKIVYQKTLLSGFLSRLSVIGGQFYKNIYRKKQKIKHKRKNVSDEKIKPDLIEARVLLKQKKFEEAEKKFIAVLKQDRKNIDAYMGLAEVYVSKKDWEAAEQTYKYILKIEHKFADAYRQLSKILINFKKWDDLRQYSNQALDLGFKQSWLYVNLGILYRKTGYPEKAEEWLIRAVEAEPGREYYLDLLLEVSIINKNKSLAEKTYNTLKQVSRDQIKLQDYRNKLDLL